MTVLRCSMFLCGIVLLGAAVLDVPIALAQSGQSQKTCNNSPRNCTASNACPVAAKCVDFPTCSC